MSDSKSESISSEAQLAEERERAREFFGPDWVDDEAEKKQELTAHEELTRSFEALSKLVTHIDVANSEWMNDLLDELNDPTKENLMSRITAADEASELIATLSVMKQDEEVPLRIEQEFFDPVRFQTDLLNVATVVDKAKQKGSKRMDKLFAGFQSYKQTQKDIISRAVTKFINDNNLPKMETRISELEDMISRMKIALMEKKYVYSMQKVDNNMSIEELRHKYEADIEEHIRHLIAKIEQNKTEIIRLDTKYAQALEATEAIKNDLSIVLHDIDKEEKTSTLKDMSLVNFINQDGVTTAERPETDIITQEDVDKSFKTLEQAMSEYALVLVKIAEAEEKTKVRRAELNAVLKSEENKALERLKNMVHEMEKKVEADRKRIPVLEVIAKHIDKEGHAAYLAHTAERRATVSKKAEGHSSHHFISGPGGAGVPALSSSSHSGAGMGHRHTVASVSVPHRTTSEDHSDHHHHGRSTSIAGVASGDHHSQNNSNRGSLSPEGRSPNTSRSPQRAPRAVESNNAQLDALLNGEVLEESLSSRQHRATFARFKANIVPEHDRPHPAHDHVGYTSDNRGASRDQMKTGDHHRHSPVFNVQDHFNEREKQQDEEEEEDGGSEGMHFDDSRVTTARGSSRGAGGGGGGGEFRSRPTTGHFSFDEATVGGQSNSMLAAYHQGMKSALGESETPAMQYALGSNLESPGSFRNKVMVSDSYAPPPSAKDDDYFPQMDSVSDDNASSPQQSGRSVHHSDRTAAFAQMQPHSVNKRQTMDVSKASPSPFGAAAAGGAVKKHRSTTIGKGGGGGGGGAGAHSYQVARSVSNYQVKKVQNVIDMFHQERSRLADPHESQQILTYSTQQMVKNVDASAVAEEVAEQLITQPLSRATLLIHNVNHTALARKASAKQAANTIKQNAHKHADRKNSKRKSIRTKSILNQSSGPNTADSANSQTKQEKTEDAVPEVVGAEGEEGVNDSSSSSEGESEGEEGPAAKEPEDDTDGVILVGVKKPTNERKVAKIRQAIKKSRPVREPFDSENYFKSANSSNNNGEEESVEAKHSSKGTRLSTMSRKTTSRFSYFDANRLVLDGQEDEAAEFYRQTYGYTIALEQLNHLTNLLTNYNSNNINELDGQVAFSKTAEEELGNVESLRHQINVHVNKIKQAYLQSNNINKILKAIQSDVNVHTRMMDGAKNDLLAAIEGVRWPKFLQPGEYQQEIDIRRARIRELKNKAKAWENKIMKQKRMNMRLSVLITDDHRNSFPAVGHRGSVGGLSNAASAFTPTPLGAIKEVVVRQNNPNTTEEPKIHVKSNDAPSPGGSTLQPKPPAQPQSQRNPLAAAARQHSFRSVPQETPASILHGGKLSKNVDAHVPALQYAPNSRESNSDNYSVAHNRLAIFNDITDIYEQTLEHLRATKMEEDRKQSNDSPTSHAV